jgi:large subunit ribosomal protein L13
VDTLSYKTKSVNKESADKKWLVIDVENQILGRAASEVAKLLRGKHKATFTPHADTGDYVIILNAEKIRLTGTKATTKTYIRHTGYPGGQRSLTVEEVLDKKPIKVFEAAVKGMLPKSKLGRAVFKNMHVYAGSEHDHEAQKPTKVELK